MAALRRAAPALAAYAGGRLLGLVCLAIWSWHLGKGPGTYLNHRWDSIWYERIADYGYGTVMPSAYYQGVFYDDLAFFPLYPALVRVVAIGSPLGVRYAALLVSWAASGFAAWGIYLVGEHLTRRLGRADPRSLAGQPGSARRVGIVLVVLWGLLPHAVIQSMAYTESLLTALAAWALYATLTKRWLYAGAFACAAGLTRPTGVALVAAVGIAGLCEMMRRRRAGKPVPRRLWAGLALAPMGWLGFLVYVGVRTGHPGGYFTVQRRWGSAFDFGANTVRATGDLITEPAQLTHHVALGVVAAALVLFLITALDRQPLPLLVYSGMLLLITLGGTNFFQCKPRFLLPAFPLLFPVATAVAGARRHTAMVLLSGCAVLSACYGTYLLTIAHSPP